MQTEFIKRPVKVLHLEDNEFDHHAVTEMFRADGLNCNFSVAKSKSEYVEALQNADHDLILSDFTLPDYNGLSALSMARKVCPDTPFVFFSGTIADEVAVDSLKNGAADYVSKQSPNRLMPSIRSALANAKARLRLRPLQQNDERLRLVARTTNDVTWDWDLITNKIRVSENFQEVFGHCLVGCEMMLGQWFDLVHPEDKGRVMSGMSVLLPGGGKVWRSEHRIRRADRTYASIFDRASVVCDAVGRPARMVGVMVDMSGCKQSEKNLAEECHLLRTLIDLIPDVIFVEDRASRNILANKAAVKLLGAQSATEIAGKSETSFFKRPCAEDLKRDNTEVINSGRALVNHEEKVVTLDGQTCWLSTSKVPWRDTDGNVIGLVGIGRDITAQKLAQEQVSQQATLLNAAQDAILVQDLEGHVRYWNKSAERAHGWSSEEIAGRNVADFLHKEPFAYHEALNQTLERGSWNGELVRTTRSGAEIVTQSRWTLVNDSEGKPESILDISTDVTEKKQLETRFLRAQQMENIGKLASGMTHDLNNILTPILISITLLQQKTNDEEMQKILRMLEANTRRAASIIKQVLWHGRDQESQRQLFNPRTVGAEVVQMISETFDKSIRIESEAMPDLWNVFGNATQIYQVLLNLCVNARDAMPTGGTLTLRTRNLVVKADQLGQHPEAKPGSYVVLEVADTGCGVPDDIRDQIFEPFFTTKEPGKGTGLGLYTARMIVKNHDGFIQVKNDQGHGAVFSVFLPAQSAAKEEPAKPQKIESLRGNNETVLVVDDEDTFLHTVRGILEFAGYRVLSANNGAQGLKTYLANSDSIAAVITDLMMPVMNGTDLSRALRRHDSAVKIMLISGLDSEITHETVAELGIQHFVAKPFTVEGMLKKLRETLAPVPAQ